VTLSELQDQIKKDLKIHPDQLDESSRITPEIHHIYNKLMMQERLALKKLNREWDKLYLQQWEYYRKKADPEVYEKKPLLKKIMDTDVKYYLSADPDLQELRSKIEAKEELIEFLKRALDQISQRNWQIRNQIEWLKFLGGEKGPK